MEERYWLRHPSLQSHQGPYSKQDLRASLESEAFPMDSYVLLDEGASEDQRRGSIQWRPAVELLGLPPLPKPAPPQRPQRPRTEFDRNQDAAIRHGQRRNTVRRQSAYSGLHQLISVLLWAGIIAILARSMLATRARGTETLTILAWAALEFIGLLVTAGLARALIDLADCSLRQLADAEPDREQDAEQDPKV